MLYLKDHAGVRTNGNKLIVDLQPTLRQQCFFFFFTSSTYAVFYRGCSELLGMRI